MDFKFLTRYFYFAHLESNFDSDLHIKNQRSIPSNVDDIIELRAESKPRAFI
jgi:hypothetical protein